MKHLYNYILESHAKRMLHPLYWFEFEKHIKNKSILRNVPDTIKPYQYIGNMKELMSRMSLYPTRFQSNKQSAWVVICGNKYKSIYGKQMKDIYDIISNSECKYKTNTLEEYEDCYWVKNGDKWCLICDPLVLDKLNIDFISTV